MNVTLTVKQIMEALVLQLVLISVYTIFSFFLFFFSPLLQISSFLPALINLPWNLVCSALLSSKESRQQIPW